MIKNIDARDKLKEALNKILDGVFGSEVYVRYHKDDHFEVGSLKDPNVFEFERWCYELSITLTATPYGYIITNTEKQTMAIFISFSDAVIRLQAEIQNWILEKCDAQTPQ